MPEDQIPGQSPRPQMPMGMDFPTALKGVISGKIMTRLEWITKQIPDYGILDGGYLKLHKPDGFHVWMVSDGDLLANDWVIQDMPVMKMN
jgi:hypothetical protein